MVVVAAVAAARAVPATEHRRSPPDRAGTVPDGGEMSSRFLAATTVAAIFFALCGAAPERRDDLVFENARVVDGTGAPAFSADVAVSGGRIAAVGRLREERK